MTLDLASIKVSVELFSSSWNRGADVSLKKRTKISQRTVMYHMCIFRGEVGLNKILSGEKLSACRLMLKHDVEISSAIPGR